MGLGRWWLCTGNKVLKAFWEVLPCAPGGPWLHCFMVTAEPEKETRDTASRLTVATSFFSRDHSTDCYKLELLSRVLRMLVLSQFLSFFFLSEGNFDIF